MHRETTVSRDIKLLKNKFELLEKNRQFRSILQKSTTHRLGSIESHEDYPSNNNLSNGSGPERDDTISEITKVDGTGLSPSCLKPPNDRTWFKFPKIKTFAKLVARSCSIKGCGLLKRKQNRVSTVSIVEPAKVDISEITDSIETKQKCLDEFELQATKVEPVSETSP